MHANSTAVEVRPQEGKRRPGAGRTPRRPPGVLLPLLIVANDPGYLGDKVNSRLSNAIASVYWSCSWWPRWPPSR